MNNTIFAAIVAIVMAAAGIGAYALMNFKSFDFDTASPAERSAYLEKKIWHLHPAFKPNILSKPTHSSANSNSVSLTYNTGMGFLTCGTEIDCKVRQCQRYLRNSVGKQNITLRLRYTDNYGRQISSQTLKPESCVPIVKRWDAGAGKRKKEKARKRKEICSDDYVGMQPLGC